MEDNLSDKYEESKRIQLLLDGLFFKKMGLSCDVVYLPSIFQHLIVVNIDLSKMYPSLGGNPDTIEELKKGGFHRDLATSLRYIDVLPMDVYAYPVFSLDKKGFDDMDMIRDGVLKSYEKVKGDIGHCITEVDVEWVPDLDTILGRDTMDAIDEYTLNLDDDISLAFKPYLYFMYGQGKCDDMSLPSAYKMIDDINLDVKYMRPEKIKK
jgi:hypothetical protein